MAFNNFPYTNAHELNLDWVISTVKSYVAQTAALAVDVAEISAQVDNFIASLDIPEEVRNQIDELISSGEFEELILQTIEDNYGNDNIYARLHGKTIIALGDSMFTGSLGSAGNTWLEMLASTYGATVYNYGVSGSKISTGGSQPSSNDMAYRIDEILSNHTTCDICVVCGGAKDYNQNVVIGEYNSHDNNTFVGAIRNIIVKIQRRYEKNCSVLFMTTYHRYDTPNNIRLNEIDYVNAMKNACSDLSIPCFDNYSSCGISLATNEYVSPQNIWADSGLVAGQAASHHFSVAAYEYLLPKYAAYLANGYVTTDNKPNPHYAELYDTTNTYKFQYVKTQETDGSWSVYGRIVIANMTYPNQFETGDEWYYSDTITFNLPADLQTDDNYGWNVTTAASEGVCICSQPGMIQAYVQLRLMRYKWNGTNNVVLTLHKRCLPAALTP